ncbi:filamentous hemagglutinin N-terminal domain-containing protein [Nitrosomonas sp. Is35]|uniref:two-partner secretion domain-containing protein n=1 Tax=Nitrosomonas sp. Is35 TaxID=3080534 RepID=UPI00294AB3C9|nr:filamentous hemagglutinin N-terminal domain-containing protein [Nitrosomonas sp. Is35]MDV6348653.1 filamentous hemagglutinin N-terminal domain-containing protein [Nitrosomonas sp. Is35]
MKNCHCFSLINEFAIGIAALLLASNAAAVNTHIQTDGSLSGIAEFNINAPGSSHPYTLSEINGKLSGHNLFYSFSDFSIGATDTAWFKLNTPDLANVITRVTGGSESLIDGKLQMTNAGSSPSFFFINPAGITFGSGASVDVPGSFYVSTASNLNFSDGHQYAAGETSASSLSSATPESFGFLGNETGNLTLSNSSLIPTELSFRSGSDIAFVGNQVQINNTSIMSEAILNNDLTQNGLDLQLIATGKEAATIELNAPSSYATAGNLTIQNAFLDASGNGSGRLVIRSGDFVATNSILSVANFGIPMSSSQGIDINVKNLLIDNSIFTSIASGAGTGGEIKVVVEDALRIQGIGRIYSQALGQGKAGNVTVSAKKAEILGIGQPKIYTGIASRAEKGSTGDAGNVTVTVTDALRMTGGGQIFSNTFSQGKSGDVFVSANQIEINGLGLQGVATGISSQAREGSANDAGNVIVEVIDTLNLIAGGQISASAFSQGKAGNINVSASRLEIDGKGLSNVVTSIASQARNGSAYDTGQIKVSVADTLKLVGGGSINSGAFSRGNAGEVRVTARNLEIDGQGFKSGISSQAEYGTGNAGAVYVDVTETLKLQGSGQISSSTFSQGKAGEVHVTAHRLKIDGQNSSNFATAIASTATEKSTGDAGKVTVVVADTIELLRSGQIGSDTSSEGIAGEVEVSAKQITIDGSGYSGDGLTGISSSAQPGSSGDAGKVTVKVADTLRLIDGGQISSSALSQSQGNAGETLVSAGELIIDGGGLSENVTGIFSATASNSMGNAGRVSVTVTDLLHMLSGGEIGSSSYSVGRAGEVIVDVGKMAIDNSVISSGALFWLNGGVGNIKINASSGDIQLNHRAFITTINLARVGIPKESGNIEINLTNGSLYLNDSSQINTKSIIGHGGKIEISAKEALSLSNSSVTTSVDGPTGNGGDINLASNFLILDTGFIEANTLAANASGGDINIQVPIIIPSGNLLFVGGNTPFQFQPLSGLNVIQAVAPDGVNGTINAITPQLNLNAMMTNLAIESFDSNVLNRDMCEVSDSSSLLQSGRGAQPLRARDLLLSPVF